MKTGWKSTPRIFKALLAGGLVWMLCMGFAVHAAWAAASQHPFTQASGTETPQPDPTTETAAGTPAATAVPKACAECHPDVNDAWEVSPHAQAFDNSTFNERWLSLGRPGECLVCHTTGFNRATGEYSAQGVTCEACHGAAIEGHPPAVMPLLADTEYCGACHTTTLNEWRFTGHAAEGVGCTDCHNPHSQAALYENPDEVCINCHKDNLGEHKNDIHIAKGIGCVACHALVMALETPPDDGLVPTGHSFTITPYTCVACHTDTLQIGTPLPGYEAGAKAVAENLPVTTTLTTVLDEVLGERDQHGRLSDQQTIQALETALASTRISTLFQGGVIGLVLGGSTAYFIARNQRGASRDDDEDTQDEDAPQGEG